MNHVIKDCAISFEIGRYESSLFLPIAISLGNLRIGTLNSPTYIPSFLHDIKRLIHDDYYFCNDINNDNFMSFFKTNDGKIIDNYYFTLEETFDDFTKRSIRNKVDIFFYFYLNKKPFFCYDDLSPESEIYIQVPMKEFVNKVNNLERLLLQNQ
ncbi:hypothetical protein [Moraxella catarrhalis]|uniref:hypothetical protein n=1 Tax=Moraxella catarrhalis TaxID=480 RepID=UPI0007E46293|nr:hypothetical protein [Moraxella catarrhalis]MPX19025.1 hypothetical protein [Moraxella catarrhalis]